MEDSDEYDYFDDITDADIAVAEEVESKFIESQRTQALRQPSELQQPPTKRQKLNHEWKDQLSHCDWNDRLARSSSLHSDELTADISLQTSYFQPVPEVKGPSARASRLAAEIESYQRQRDTHQPSSVARRSSYGTVPGQRTPAPSAVRHVIRPQQATPPLVSPGVPTPPSSQRAPPGSQRDHPPQRASLQAPFQRAHSHDASLRAPLPAASQRGISSPLGVVQRTPAPPLVRHGTTPQRSSTLRQSTNDGDERLRKELEDMRLQMEQLKQGQQQLQRSLRESEDARYAKQGEVSILRKGIQKTAQEHAAEIAKVKAAKEAAEAMQLKIQGEMKEELDRMKTQFTFKQHEIETSGRISPWTSRSRKISRQAPPTPVRMPSQMREWNPHGNDTTTGPSGFSQAIVSTSQSHITNASAQEHKTHKAHAVPERLKLPGFVNAFDTLPPTTASQAVKGDKGKRSGNGNDNGGCEKKFPSVSSVLPDHPSSHPRFVSPPRRQRSPSGSPPASPLGHKQGMQGLTWDRMNGANQDHDDVMQMMGEPTQLAGHADVAMVDAAAKGEPSPDVAEDITAMDWAAEVHRVILTHKCPYSSQLTMQLLVGMPLPEEALVEHREAYGCLSRRLLENMSEINIGLMDADLVLGTVLNVLVDMVDVLEACAMMIPLTSLLNMLRVLALCLPMFCQLMFARPPKGGDDPILCVICKIIRQHLAPIEGERTRGFDDLARETLSLLEVIIWVIPEEHVPRLAAILDSSVVLHNLLAPVHPTWLLHRSMRVLALLASHHSLFRHLLSIPDPDPHPGVVDVDTVSKDFSKIPHIEQMSTYLRDATREGAEVDALREAIMTFIAGLTIASPDALTILQQSDTLIPSVIVFVSNLTRPLFEEDPDLMEDTARLDAIALQAVRTVSVLYTLVFGTDSSSFHLYHKLRRVPHREFPSIYNVAVVTFGRMSWAEPPLDASENAKNLLDQGIDLAKELLNTLVDQPQLEMVWAAFQHAEPEPAGPREGRIVEDEDYDEGEEGQNQEPPLSPEV